jgi:hypothetical protein
MEATRKWKASIEKQINKTNVQCSLQLYVVEFYPLLVAFEQNTRHCIHQLSQPVSLSSFAHLSPIQSRSTSWFNKARNWTKEVIPTVKMKLWEVRIESTSVGQWSLGSLDLSASSRSGVPETSRDYEQESRECAKQEMSKSSNLTLFRFSNYFPLENSHCQLNDEGVAARGNGSVAHGPREPVPKSKWTF